MTEPRETDAPEVSKPGTAAIPDRPLPDEAPSGRRSGLPAFLSGAVLLVGAGIFAWSLLTPEGGGAAQGGGGHGHGGWGGGGGAQGPTPVRVHDVAVGSLTTERRVPGEVFVTRRGALRARVTGEVDRVTHRLGELVEEGALLVGLDAGTLPAELRRARALQQAAVARRQRAEVALEQARRELRRREGLRQEGAVSAAELERAETDVDLAEADLALARAEEARAAADVDVLGVQLSHTRVVAPFRGRVAEVLVEEGSAVTAGAQLITLVADEAPRVRFSVGEAEAAGLKLGAPVIVHAGGAELEGEVAAVGAAIDPESRTLPVEATLAATEGGPAEGAAEGLPIDRPTALLPGAYVEVEVAMGATEDATLVPLEALLGEGPVRKLFVVEGGKAKQIEARVLLEDGRRAAVSGIDVGQRVVVGGGDDLKDGAEVEVVQ